MKPEKLQLWFLVLAVLVAAALPVYALKWGASPWWAITTPLLVVALVKFGGGLRSQPARVTLVLGIAGVFLFANCLLAASYYVQRAGINQQFFDQLNLNARFALRGYYSTVIAAFAYVFFGSVAVLIAATRLAKSGVVGFRWPSAVLLIGALVVFTPSFQALSFLSEKYMARSLFPAAAARDLREASPVTPPPPEPVKTRSLVLIYLEGIEVAFLDTPGLMPRLNQIRDRTIEYNNIKQVVGGTIGGIVSTQCGWPPFSGSSIYSDPEFYPGFECLGDMVEEQGYTSVFLGGADLRFTSKDRFFVTHGFSSVSGLYELKPLLPDPEYVSEKWGIWDDSLFEIGRSRFDELAADSMPFMLVFLTIATHTPGFAAPSCPEYGGSEDPMLKAVHCTDLLVADFIDHVRQSEISDDVLIALVSDHLMWGGIEPLGIQIPDEDRRLTFLVDDPRQPGRKDPVAGSEFEVGLTLAAMMGVNHPPKMGLGHSLLEREGFVFSPEGGFKNMWEIEKFLRSDQVKELLEQARSADRTGAE